MKIKNVMVVVTCAIFLTYFSNVIAGATGVGIFLSDIVEMLTLLAACICFVVAMLLHERAAQATEADSAEDPTLGGGTVP